MPALIDLHAMAMKEFDRRVQMVGADDWGRPTPCADWSVHELVAHLVTEQMWVPYLLGGGGIADAGDRFDGDVMGTEPIAAWDELSEEAREAWLEPGATDRIVHLSFGDAPGSAYLWQMTFDLAVHAWDLARAIEADEKLDPELVCALLDSEELSGEIVEGQNEGDAGIFAPQPEVPADAAPQTVLLARTGRKA